MNKVWNVKLSVSLCTVINNQTNCIILQVQPAYVLWLTSRDEMCKMLADAIPIYSYWRHPDLQNALRHHSGNSTASESRLVFDRWNVYTSTTHGKWIFFWQASFPDLARPLQCVGVVDYNASNKPKIYLSILPELKPRILTFSRKIADINNWCLAFINSQVRRCSVDSEWSMERRTNGGPGRKMGKIAVLSASYLTLDTPQGLTLLEELLPYCRVAIFQVSHLEELPRYLVQLLQASTITKTGKVCIISLLMVITLKWQPESFHILFTTSNHVRAIICDVIGW